MKLFIDNVGLISKSNIILDGLTVITGKNDSGKSTVGKILCSLIIATKNLKQSSIKDKLKYSVGIMSDIVSKLNLFDIYRRFSKNNLFSENFPVLTSILEFKILSEISFESELHDLLNKFRNEINNFNIETILMWDDSLKKSSIIGKYSGNFFEKKVLNANEVIDKLIKTLEQDSSLTKYSSQKILDSLNNSFYQQIAPIRYPDRQSKIVLADEEYNLYDIKIQNNNINENCFNGEAFSGAYLINDVNILDHLTDYKNSLKFKNIPYWYMARSRDTKVDYSNFMSVLSDICDTTENILMDALIKDVTSFETQTYQLEMKKLFDYIDKKFSDDLIFVDGKFICKKTKLDIRNLATGSKLFAILKMLMEHGEFKEDNIIILDEPENHLHPEWQNALAELIVLLYKERNVKFVITTHSPNFLLALQTMSLKYEINKNTYFYFSVEDEKNHMVEIKNYTDAIEKIHYNLSSSYITMDDLLGTLEEEKNGYNN